MKKNRRTELSTIIKAKIVADYEVGFAIDDTGYLVTESNRGMQKIDELQQAVERQYVEDYARARALDNKLRQAQAAYRDMIGQRANQ